MKFQVKALAAAMALLVSGVASAASAPNTGNSSLILSVFDRTNNQQTWVDTGWTYSTLNEIGTDFADTNFDASAQTLTFNSAAISSFLSTADVANTYYAIFAGDTSGLGTVAGAKGMIATFNTAYYDASVADPVNPFSWSKSGMVNQTSQAYNFMTGTQGGALQYFQFDNMSGFGPSVAINTVGGSLGLYQTIQNAGPNSAGTSTFIYGNTTVSLSTAGALTISSVPTVTTPVPEADSYAMMGLGLAVVAAVARRRKAA